VAVSNRAPGEPLQQLAGGVAGADRLGERAVDRAGVHALVELERGDPGDVVAMADGGRHRRGAAPCRQQGEVQVEPAVAWHVQRHLRQQRAVGDHRADVGAQLAELLDELRFGRTLRPQDRHAAFLGELGDRRRAELAAPAGGRVRSGDDGEDLVPR
jgi:hypothetical protein